MFECLCFDVCEGDVYVDVILCVCVCVCMCVI